MFAIIFAHTHHRARWAFFLAPLVMLGEVFSDLQQPTLMSRIVDHGLARGDMAYVGHTALWMAFFALFGLACGVGCNALGSYASLKMGQSLRQHMLTVALNDRAPRELAPATLITRITNDVTQMQNLVMMVTRGMVRSPLLLVGGIVMSIIVSPALAPILYVAMPLLVVFLLVIVRRSLPLYTRMQQAVDRVNQGMRENLSGAKTIKSYGLEPHMLRTFNRDNENLRARSEKAALATAPLAPVIQLVLNLGVVLALGYGGMLAVSRTISDGQIIAFVNYMIQITTAMINTVNIITAFSRAITSAARVHEALAAEAGEAPVGTAKAPADSSVSFNDVSFGYDQRQPILAHVSFAVPAGQWLGIIGATGSGKTSLINLLTRTFDEYSGTIQIGGVDIQTLALTAVHQKVAVALQDAQLFSGTIRSNLAFGAPHAPVAQLEAAAHTAAIDDLVHTAPQRYDTPVEQKGKNFSGGQRQRFNIARALTPQPDILVMDDATSAVDQTTNATIRARLATSRHGKTTLIISQRVTNVMDCDNIIVLAAGRVVAQGTHAQLLQRSAFYRALVQTQLGGGQVAAN